MPASDSMVVAATAMPNRPATMKVMMMPTMIVSAGRAVDSSDMARPWITLVPWPETLALATDFTGRKPVPV
jgi:hypothetical protein